MPPRATYTARLDTVPPPDPKGAYDYLLKPLDLQKLDRVLGEALKVARLMREPAVVVGAPPDDGQAGEATVGSCPEARSAAAALRPGVDRRETGPGRPPAGHHPPPAGPCARSPASCGCTSRTPWKATKAACRSRTGCCPRDAYQSRLKTAWARDPCVRRIRTFFTNRAIRDHLRASPRQAAGALRTIRPA